MLPVYQSTNNQKQVLQILPVQTKALPVGKIAMNIYIAFSTCQAFLVELYLYKLIYYPPQIYIDTIMIVFVLQRRKLSAELNVTE